MSAAKHTPGPWIVSHAGTGRDGKFVIDEYFVTVDGADMAIAADIIDPITGKLSEANARLIAAAPDLLAALQELADDISERHDLTSRSTNPGIKNTVAAARAAIAKAQDGAA